MSSSIMNGRSTELVVTLPEHTLETLLRVIARQVAEEIADNQSTQPRWFDVAGVATYAVMTEQAVRDAEKHGHLRAHRTTSGRLRFRIEDVEAFLAGRPA